MLQAENNRRRWGRVTDPRLLFPFARELIASAISNGGFPPLMLQPIDFVGLYQRRLADMQTQQAPTQA